MFNLSVSILSHLKKRENRTNSLQTNKQPEQHPTAEKAASIQPESVFRRIWV